jgi:NAD(P)-dependent dehydrogenase (short-subunit alcohol dehydrogenase family)
VQEIPLQRFALPENIVATALFLAGDAANMITGETVVVDGDFTIR